MTARWTELTLRKDALKPYGRDAETKTLYLLETALLPTNAPEVDPIIQMKLRDAAAHDIEQLLPHLNQRGAELADSARALLAKRAKQEAIAMRSILEEQKKRVAETAGKYRETQLYLDFNDEERRGSNRINDTGKNDFWLSIANLPLSPSGFEASTR